MANEAPESLGERIARLDQIAHSQSQTLTRIERALESQASNSIKLTNIEAVVKQSQELLKALDKEVDYLKEENRDRLTEINANTQFIKTRFWMVTTIGLLFLAVVDLAFRMLI